MLEHLEYNLLLFQCHQHVGLTVFYDKRIY